VIRIDRLDAEKEHGKYIAKDPEKVWNYDTKAGRYRADWKSALIANEADISDDTKALELGCGTGEYTKRFVKIFPNLIATDISKELLKVARKRVKDIKFEVADSMNLHYKDKSFDVVIGNSILHHLDIDKSLDEIFRVLKTGGKMIFCEPNMANPYILIQKNSKFVKKITGDSPTETAFFKNQMKKLLRKHRFINIKVEPIDFMPPFTPDALFKPVKIVSEALEKTPVVKEISGVLFIRAKRP